MTSPDSRLEDLERQFDNLAELSEYNELVENVTKLSERLDEVLGDYPFIEFLKGKLDDARQHLEGKQEELEGIASMAKMSLRGELRRARNEVEDAVEDPDNERDQEKAAEALDELEEELSGYTDKLEEAYKDIADSFYQFERRVAAAERYLKNAADITFDLGGDEKIILADKAEYNLTGKSRKDPDGYLFLTTERIIFEQREKTGGRMGFGGQMEQEVEWEASLSDINDVESENKGLLGGKDMITFKTGDGDALFELKGGAANEFWFKLVEAVRNGDDINNEDTWN